MSIRALVKNDINLDALAFAIARNHCGANEPINNVLAAEGVTADDFMRIADDKVFQRSVQNYTKELTENGTSFQLKARLQAEDLLARQFLLIHDPETPPAVAVKAIENTVRWAGLEPKTTGNGAGGAGGPQFQIIFNLESSKPVVIDAVKEVQAL
jgi:hypothetical protein